MTSESGRTRTVPRGPRSGARSVVGSWPAGQVFVHPPPARGAGSARRFRRGAGLDAASVDHSTLVARSLLLGCERRPEARAVDHSCTVRVAPSAVVSLPRCRVFTPQGLDNAAG